MREKENIVREAYGHPGVIARSVRSCARQYNVQPQQIRRWKRLFDAQQQQAEANPEARAVTQNRSRRTVHRGGQPLIAQVDLDHLTQYYHGLREEGRPVSIRMLVVELCRHNADYLRVERSVLHQRVDRHTKTLGIRYRRVTRVAQNHRFNAVVIQDWLAYINGQVVTHRFAASQIVNIDETNIDFDPTFNTTLANIGQRHIVIRNNGSP